MSWYGIKTLFALEHPDEKLDDEAYNENILLVSASTEEEAREKALKWCKNEEVSYKNVYDKTVNWKFIEIVDVYELAEDEIKDCTEVYSGIAFKPVKKG